MTDLLVHPAWANAPTGARYCSGFEPAASMQSPHNCP